MNVDDVIHDFAVAGRTLPKASMQWALDNWDVAPPRFHELLERYADGLDRSKEKADALFFVIHLIGEKRAASVFPALCRLCSDRPVRESFGDGVTETLQGILISAYDGEAGHLQRVIESSADEFVRAAALEAMGYLSAHGAIDQGVMRDYLLKLYDEMEPREESFVWSAWALTVANLGYEDFSEKVGELFRRGFVAQWDMNRSDFDRQLRLTLADPEREAGFKADRIAPFEDAIGVLSTWYAFSEERRSTEAQRLVEKAGTRPSWDLGRPP
jgi:hypothetical protein